MKSLIQKWLLIPRKFKLLLLIITLAIFLFITFVVSRKIIIKQGGISLKVANKKAETPTDTNFVKLEIPEKETPFFKLEPSANSKYGLLPKSTFILSSKSSINENFISSHLTSSVALSVSKVNDNQYQLKPASPYGLEKLVNIKLAVKGTTDTNHNFDRDYGWAYQTQKKFGITGTIPGDKKTSVPINSGIEFSFSQDDYTEPNITVEPKFEYRPERHNETYVLVPLKPLVYDTIYTITLKKGLSPTSRNDPLVSDYTIVFQTQTEPKIAVAQPDLTLAQDLIEVSPQDHPMIKVNTNNWDTNLTVKTEIYKFPSGSEFIASRKEIDQSSQYWYETPSQDKLVDVASYAKLSSFDAKVTSNDNLEYLEFPAGLNEGTYLVRLSWGDGKQIRQLWLQSTYVSSYISVGRFQTLVWVNDLKTKTSLDGALVKVYGGNVDHFTSSDGVSLFSTPEILFANTKHYFQITKDNNVLYLPIKSLSSNPDQNEESSDDYWSYLYNERSLYKVTDVVNYWGVVKKRDSGIIPPVVQVYIQNGYGNNMTNGQLSPQKIETASDGSFYGQIKYSDLPAGSYNLTAQVGDVVIATNYLEVKDFQKPDIKLEVSADKKAIFAGEKVNYKITASFYDNTPAANIKLKVQRNINYKEDQIITNEKGEFNYEYLSSFTGSTSNYPRYESITVNLALVDNSPVEGYGSVFVFGSKLSLKTSSSQENNKGKINIDISKVNLTKFNSGESQDTDSGPQTNQSLKLTVTKNWWETIENGTYYDYIEKITRPTYNYIKHQDKIDEKNLKTDNLGKANYEFNMDKGFSYIIEVTTSDEDSHQLESNQYYYYFDEVNQNQNNQGSNPVMTLTKKDNSFSLNEKVDLAINKNNKPYLGTSDSKYLFTLAYRGKQDYFVETTPEKSFEFTAKYIPNAYASGIIFNGSHYIEVSGSCDSFYRCRGYGDYNNYFEGIDFKYQSNDSKIDLEITADNPKYLPGKRANVSVKASKSGSILPNTSVQVVLVDEALEAIGGVVKPSVLSSLYTSQKSDIYFVSYTHKSPIPNPSQAEMGGGGGGYREIFKDTAYFATTKTDSDGVARFSFDLPDNITTWLIYTQAVDSFLNAGQVEGKLVVSKNFFVTSNFPSQFLAADSPFLAASSFGINTQTNLKVNYEVKFFQNDIEKEKSTKEGTSYVQTLFPFPKLPLGSYKAGVKGVSGDLNDAVLLPFSVINSRLTVQTSKKFVIDQNSEKNLNIGKYETGKPVTIILTDTGKGRYFYNLYNYCWQVSNRIEKLIASQKAASLLSELFNDNHCEGQKVEISKYQGTDGGLAQVVWGSSEVSASTWAVFTQDLEVDKVKLANYFESVISNSVSNSPQKIYAAWGLVLLGKPALTSLTNLVEISTLPDEKILGTLAMASVGQTESAREKYYEILSDWAYTSRPYIRIQADRSGTSPVNDKWLINTAYTVLIGSLVDQKYNDGLNLYLRDYGSRAQDIVLDLARIDFIKEEVSKLPKSDTRVLLTTASGTQELDLSKGESKYFELGNNQIQGTLVKVIAGKAEATVAYYLNSDSLADITKDSRLTIKRSYKNLNGGNTIKPGDVIEVKIDYNLNPEAPLGMYKITDYLPSGLVFITNPANLGLTQQGWAGEDSHNVITDYFYYSPWWLTQIKPVIYYARATSSGTFESEPAILQSQLDLGVLQATQKENITISL